MPLAISTEFLLGGVGSLGAAAAVYAYGAMSHGSQLFGRTLIAPPRTGELALTFDDGPNPAWTPRLLDILAEAKNAVVESTSLMAYMRTEDSLAMIDPKTDEVKDLIVLWGGWIHVDAF